MLKMLGFTTVETPSKIGGKSSLSPAKVHPQILHQWAWRRAGSPGGRAPAGTGRAQAWPLAGGSGWLDGQLAKGKHRKRCGKTLKNLIVSLCTWSINGGFSCFFRIELLVCPRVNTLQYINSFTLKRAEFKWQVIWHPIWRGLCEFLGMRVVELDVPSKDGMTSYVSLIGLDPTPIVILGTIGHPKVRRNTGFFSWFRKASNFDPKLSKFLFCSAIADARAKTPPYTGYGSWDDSMGSVTHLIPKLPKKAPSSDCAMGHDFAVAQWMPTSPLTL